MYIISFSIGCGPIPWLMMAEIFPDDVRGKACLIAAAVNWGCSFVVTCTVKVLKGVLESAALFILWFSGRISLSFGGIIRLETCVIGISRYVFPSPKLQRSRTEG